MNMESKAIDGFFYGAFSFTGTRLRKGKVEKVSGDIGWRTMDEDGDSDERRVTVAMCIEDDSGSLPGGVTFLDRTSICRLSEGDRKTQNNLLEMMGWEEREGYVIQCA